MTDSTTGLRRVQRKGNPQRVYFVVATCGGWLWVTDEDNFDDPWTVWADLFEDAPLYNPEQVPQVGEFWAYSPDADNTTAWLCVASDTDKGLWSFVAVSDTESQTGPMAALTEAVNRIQIYTHKLPEQRMKKCQ